MNCIYCGEPETKVLDSRLVDNHSIKRRRECLKCKRRFTTYETPEETQILVIKKDNTREVFDKNKILKGIVSSCVKRPVSKNDMENLVNEVEKEVYRKEVKEISSYEIGEMVLEKLKALDEVAYVRFASVYRDFKEVSNFKTELNNLNKKK